MSNEHDKRGPPAGMPRFLANQARIMRLPAADETRLLARLQALPPPSEASEPAWRAVEAEIDATLERLAGQSRRIDALRPGIRALLDDLRFRTERIARPERMRWMHWLALVSEQVDAAVRERDPVALERLAAEAREHARHLPAQPRPAGDPDCPPPLAELRAAARGILDDAERMVARLPRREEDRARGRLTRLRKLFHELASMQDVNAARVLMIHLEDALEDILRETTGRGPSAETVADEAPREFGADRQA